MDKRLAGGALPITPKVMDYAVQIDKKSMLNTPPCWCIYMLGLTLDWVMRRTRIGKAVRAVAQNGNAATLMGINVGAIVVLAFVVSSSLAGLAGLLIAPITTASVFMGLTLALKAFSSAIVGGLTSPRGCMLGGVLLGVIEALVGLWHAELREISIFVLIIVVLVVRPQGLLGQPIVEKV